MWSRSLEELCLEKPALGSRKNSLIHGLTKNNLIHSSFIYGLKKFHEILALHNSIFRQITYEIKYWNGGYVKDVAVWGWITVRSVYIKRYLLIAGIYGTVDNKSISKKLENTQIKGLSFIIINLILKTW